MASMIGRMARRLGRSDSGAELVEFALTLPLLLLLVMGIIEFGLVFREYEVVTNAAREGARIAILPSYAVTEDERKANAEARVNQYLTAAKLDDPVAAVVVSNPTAEPLVAPAAGTVCTITVTVTYPHSVTFVGGIFSLFGGSLGTDGVISVVGSSTMRTEAAAAAGC